MVAPAPILDAMSDVEPVCYGCGCGAPLCDSPAAADWCTLYRRDVLLPWPTEVCPTCAIDQQVHERLLAEQRGWSLVPDEGWFEQWEAWNLWHVAYSEFRKPPEDPLVQAEYEMAEEHVELSKESSTRSGGPTACSTRTR